MNCWRCGLWCARCTCGSCVDTTITSYIKNFYYVSEGNIRLRSFTNYVDLVFYISGSQTVSCNWRRRTRSPCISTGIVYFRIIKSFLWSLSSEYIISPLVETVAAAIPPLAVGIGVFAVYVSGRIIDEQFV